MNSIQAFIQFPMEKEQDNKLPFLDVLVTRKEQEFRSSVYHKPTFTGQYLNFNSHHPYNVKKGIVDQLQPVGSKASIGRFHPHLLSHCDFHLPLFYSCHLYVKMDRCGTDTSSWPVFGAILYQKTASWGEIWLFSATAFMVPPYDPIAARVERKSKVSPNPPLFTQLSKNFQMETNTVIYQHLLYWSPSPETPQQLFHCLFGFFTISLLSQVQSIMDRYDSWQ